MLVALLQGSRVLTFFGGPLLLYPYRTGDDDDDDDDEDISELPAESVVSFLLFFFLAPSNISMNLNDCSVVPDVLHQTSP